MASESGKSRGFAKAESGEAPALVVELADNSLLAPLFGEHDRHLARIEQALGVTLAPRGNRVAISGGGSGQAMIARDVLEALYRRLSQGETLGPGDVDGAIRMAGQPPAEGGLLRTRKRPIAARSPNQALYLKSLQRFDLVFGVGPAGTGKTYLAVAVAVSTLLSGKVDHIILSRPAVEAGERLGFLPGDMREKIDPYLRPLYDALYDMLPADQVMKRLESGEIEVAPLAFMRGRTLSNAFVILDEAQNTTPVQMKMLLTRLGENSRMVVTGDLSQVDLPVGMLSGLRDALSVLDGLEEVAVVRFTAEDVVRHPLVTRLVQAYGKREAALPGHRMDEGGAK